MATLNLKLNYVDEGYCRIVYKSESGCSYCLQEERDNYFEFYRTTGGDWDEPSYPVDFKHVLTIEPAPEDSPMGKRANQWVSLKGIK
jgi:hypothetical protein